MRSLTRWQFGQRTAKSIMESKEGNYATAVNKLNINNLH